MVNCYRPGCLSEALDIRKNKDVAIIAGGTDLMVKRKTWAGLSPSFKKDVLFVGHLKELRNIEYEKNFLKIGAVCTITEIIESKAVPDYMKDILKGIASPAIRNAATIGGNICNSSPAGDTLPLLYALDAQLMLACSDGEREISIEDFIYGPGNNYLGEDELLKEISIELKPFNNVFHRKIGARKANSISKTSFIGLGNIKDGTIEDIRISFGAVAKTVVRSKDIEEKLKGAPLKDIKDNFLELKELYSNLINSIDDQRSSKDYREETSIKLLEKFLLEELKF